MKKLVLGFCSFSLLFNLLYSQIQEKAEDSIKQMKIQIKHFPKKINAHNYPEMLLEKYFKGNVDINSNKLIFSNEEGIYEYPFSYESFTDNLIVRNAGIRSLESLLMNKYCDIPLKPNLICKNDDLKKYYSRELSDVYSTILTKMFDVDKNFCVDLGSKVVFKYSDSKFEVDFDYSNFVRELDDSVKYYYNTKKLGNLKLERVQDKRGWAKVSLPIDVFGSKINYVFYLINYIPIKNYPKETKFSF